MNMHGDKGLVGFGSRVTVRAENPFPSLLYRGGQGESLFDAQADRLHLGEIFERVPVKRQEAGFVSFFEPCNLSAGEDRRRCGFAPQFQERQIVEREQHLEIHHFSQRRVGMIAADRQFDSVTVVAG